MNELPWWAFSPSPFSIAFYIVLISISARVLLRRNQYEKFPRLSAITDAFFILGFFVLFSDLVWVICCAFRFGLLFFDSLPQLLMCAGRDFTGVLLCSYWVREANRRCLINITSRTSRLFVINMLFLIVWFCLAPNPAFTDWTFALRHGFSVDVAIFSFFLSHIIGRFILGLAYLSLWF